MNAFSIFGQILIDGVDAARSALTNIGTRATAAGAALQRFGDSASQIGGKLTAGITGPITAAQAAVAGLIGTVSEFVNEIRVASERAGISTDNFQKMAFVMRELGFTTDETADLMGDLRIAIGDATDLESDQANVLRRLGFSFSQIASGAITADQALGALLRGAGRLGSAAEQTRAAVILTGEELGGRLANAARKAGKDLDQLYRSAKDQPGFISEEQIKTVESFRISWDKMKTALMGAFVAVATQVMPVLENDLFPLFIEKGVPAIESVLGVLGKLAEWFSALPSEMQGLVVAGVLIAQFVGPVVTAVGGLISLFGALLPVFGAVATAVGAISAPVLVLVGLAALLIANWDKVKVAFGVTWTFILALVESVADSVDKAIMSVIASIGSIFPRLGEWLSKFYAWVKSIPAMIWNGLKSVGAILYQALVKPFADAWKQAKAYLNDILSMSGESSAAQSEAASVAGNVTASSGAAVSQAQAGRSSTMGAGTVVNNYNLSHSVFRDDADMRDRISRYGVGMVG